MQIKKENEPFSCVELVFGQTNEAEDFHALVKIPYSKYSEYQEALKHNCTGINLLEYSEIIATFWGHEPDQELLTKLIEEQGDGDDLVFEELLSKEMQAYEAIYNKYSVVN